MGINKQLTKKHVTGQGVPEVPHNCITWTSIKNLIPKTDNPSFMESAFKEHFEGMKRTFLACPE